MFTLKQAILNICGSKIEKMEVARTALLETAKGAFQVFLEGNNKTAIVNAVEYATGVNGKIIKEGFRLAFLECNQGYVAPKGKKFTSQSEVELTAWSEKQASMLVVFTATVEPLFAVVEKTAEEKAKAKAEKAEKTAKALATSVSEEVTKLGLVDPKTIRPFTNPELVGAVIDALLEGAVSILDLESLQIALTTAMLAATKAAEAAPIAAKAAKAAKAKSDKAAKAEAARLATLPDYEREAILNATK